MSHFFPSLSSFSANACIVVCSNAERILSIDDSVSDIVVVVISPNRMPRVDVVLYVDFLSARRMRAVVGAVVWRYGRFSNLYSRGHAKQKAQTLINK